MVGVAVVLKHLEQDKEICMKQQPINVGGIHKDLAASLHTLKGILPSQNVQPPVLHFGWKLTEEEVLDVLRAEFPRNICKLGGTLSQLRCIDPMDFESDPTDDPCTRRYFVRDSAFASLFGPTLIHAVRKRIGVRKFIAPLVAFRVVRDSDNKAQYAVTVGDNYNGVVNPAVRTKLCELFGLDEKEGVWFLDTRYWYWNHRGELRCIAQWCRNVTDHTPLQISHEGLERFALPCHLHHPRSFRRRCTYVLVM